MSHLSNSLFTDTEVLIGSYFNVFVSPLLLDTEFSD